MLLRAVYPYEGPFNGSLKFKTDDLFLKIRSENEYWHLVANNNGTLGCVPKNYVEEHKNQDESSVIDFAKRALRSFSSCKTEIKDKGGLLSVLQLLAQVSNDDSQDSEVQSIGETRAENRSISSDSRGTSSSHAKKHSPKRRTNSEVSMPGNLAPLLVDSLRLGTNASYADCYQSFHVMIGLLASQIPGFDRYAQCLLDSTMEQPNEIYEQSSDWHFLTNHFTFLEKRSTNDHEFSWKLHDDQVDVERRLDSLNQLLQKAQQDLVKCFLTSDRFRRFSSLIELYQRETIPSVKSRLLLAIGICSSLDISCARVSLNSDLPSELIREIGSSSTTSDVHHIAMCLRLLTMLLAQANALQVVVKSLLTVEFLSHVLSLIGPIRLASPQKDLISLTDIDLLTESPHSNQESSPSYKTLFGGRLSHAATTLLLACNWHFCSIAVKRETSNSQSTHVPLIDALLKHPNASQHFLELVVQAFNRDLDPVFRVSFKPAVNTRRRECLMYWDHGFISGSTLSMTGGLLPVDSDGLSAMLTSLDPVELDQSPLTLAEEDVGLYARSLWTDNLTITTSQSSDPVQLPASIAQTTPRHTVMKVLYDLFSARVSSELVYRNDRNVMIDVIIRQLSNLRLSESERVLDYCLLLGLIIAHSDYVESGAYKGRELIDALNMLLHSEAAEFTPFPSTERGLRLAEETLSRLRQAVES
ncbi:NCK-interacting protein with SH3 domain [Fasciola hepatica]|uniref:NCK-interacting protein with SH3 domain n=1 Tax=Fasciola hepatica TaxID=6192 RepID=A0A4E0RAE8_FASHE|nr:NCK-interacting protein with SH3 domain [Fasciola hepatica]